MAALSIHEMLDWITKAPGALYSKFNRLRGLILTNDNKNITMNKILKINKTNQENVAALGYPHENENESFSLFNPAIYEY